MTSTKDSSESSARDSEEDEKVYQTTDLAYDQHIDQNDEDKFPSGSVPGDQDFDALKSDDNTHYLGQTNEFGLIQLTGMGNANIVNNTASEDTYSYTNKAGNTVAAGKHGDDWVKPSTAAAFNAAVNSFVASEGDQSIRIVVNDGSAFNPAKDLGHTTHFTGKSIDFRFLNGTASGSSNIN